eukprot:CAMPEP_0184502992 /NCGR_PEP_ID=MMETSP0113_2-20130426/51611_1 /TAXON_ID=91329 /ORGANISM="Norrisiella sphaerica, Strain BC52" /LENGTH=110 /DNA_ID=CAMNT_0026892377 /DNA_START=446 /DNA_END=778 /DNA_ORIENTATION=+
MDDEVMGIGSGNIQSLNSAERKITKERITKVMENLLKLAEKEGVDAKVKIVDGYPKVKICEMAGKTKADFVVLASRGLGSLGRLFLGSVSDYCVHNCPSTVVLVKDVDLK